MFSKALNLMRGAKEPVVYSWLVMSPGGLDAGLGLSGGSFVGLSPSPARSEWCQNCSM